MKKKILIADDTKLWQLYNKDIIHQLYGDLFEITLADSAKEALNIITNNMDDTPFALILTDLQMEDDYEPKLAGEWLIEQIQSIYNDNSIKIIIISSMYNIEFTAKRLNVEFISKSALTQNNLYLKYKIEKLMPFINEND